MTASRIPNVEGGIQPTIVTAKGDLVTAVANANPARLGVGSDGTVLTADSSSATGLSYQNNFAAGKNKIINGDFGINQRAFTTNSTSGAYSFDRWAQFNGGTTGTLTITPQTFTAGSAPITGYEGTTFAQYVTAAGVSTDTFALAVQKIEDVRTFANQTIAVSFFARAVSGTPKIAVETEQVFGTGGSPSATVSTPAGSITLSTSWARYTISFTVPSISGKTLGTTLNTSYLALNFWFSAGSTFATRASSIGLQNATFQIWGVQAENGSTATAFQTATGTLQGELAACQRYFYSVNYLVGTKAAYVTVAMGRAVGTTSALVGITFPVSMRVAPTSVAYGGNIAVDDGSTAPNLSALTINQAGTNTTLFSTTVTGVVANRPVIVYTNNDTTAYVHISAEL